jgi:hypothetical protein
MMSVFGMVLAFYFRLATRSRGARLLRQDNTCLCLIQNRLTPGRTIQVLLRSE